MIQFYFLSILFNAASGYLLIRKDDSETDPAEPALPGFLQNETLHLVLGLLTVVTGFLKILSPAEANTPVIGDFIPVLAGIAAGFTLIVEFYRSHSTIDSELSSGEPSEKVTHLLVKNRRWIGFAAIAAAALHFLFPGVPLL
ncbi:hypothetical protein FACS1894124_1700 [Spirochaetia bacterium]|nr:hypothetical protein FACS1894124_1700 [Spirochaetia bacterium]